MNQEFPSNNTFKHNITSCCGRAGCVQIHLRIDVCLFIVHKVVKGWGREPIIEVDERQSMAMEDIAEISDMSVPNLDDLNLKFCA